MSSSFYFASPSPHLINFPYSFLSLSCSPSTARCRQSKRLLGLASPSVFLSSYCIPPSPPSLSLFLFLCFQRGSLRSPSVISARKLLKKDRRNIKTTAIETIIILSNNTPVMDHQRVFSAYSPCVYVSYQTWNQYMRIQRKYMVTSDINKYSYNYEADKYIICVRESMLQRKRSIYDIPFPQVKYRICWGYFLVHSFPSRHTGLSYHRRIAGNTQSYRCTDIFVWQEKYIFENAHRYANKSTDWTIYWISKQAYRNWRCPNISHFFTTKLSIFT